MHRYEMAFLDEIHIGWLFVPICTWLILISMALSIPVQNHKVGVRNELPNPCDTHHNSVTWHSGRLCEFAGVDSVGVLK
jgi:hypothetical protein